MNEVDPIKSTRKLGAIKALLRGSNLRDYALFAFGINAALRVGDLLALKVGDVLDGRGEIRGEIRVRMQKTGAEVRVDIPQTARDALSEYLQTRDLTDYDAPLFPGRDGARPLHRSTVHRIIQRAAEAVGLEGRYSSHSLRKTWGYHAHKRGFDIHVISQKLGHADAGVTRRYIGITADDVKDAVTALNL